MGRRRRKRLADEPLPVKEGPVRSVAFSPDGKTIAAGYSVTRGSGVVLFDAAARNRLVNQPLPVNEGYVDSVAFSPDGKIIAAGYDGADDVGGVVLWDVAARKRLVNVPLAVKEGDLQPKLSRYPDDPAMSPFRSLQVAANHPEAVWDVVRPIRRNDENAKPHAIAARSAGVI